MKAVARSIPTTVPGPTTGSCSAPQLSLGAPTHDEIARTAYLIWAARGRIHGDDVGHWLEAEARLRRERPRSK